jgi:hypothetical protein
MSHDSSKSSDRKHCWNHFSGGVDCRSKTMESISFGSVDRWTTIYLNSLHRGGDFSVLSEPRGQLPIFFRWMDMIHQAISA